MAKAGELTTLSGRILPWAERMGGERVLCLVTAKNEAYVIEQDGPTPGGNRARLVERTGEWLELTGVVRRRDGRRCILVRGFREANDASWDDDEEEDW